MNNSQSVPSLNSQLKISNNYQINQQQQQVNHFKQPRYNYSKKFNEIDNQNQSITKPDPFKYKSAEQIVNEFKASSLPKLRLKGLIKLQAVMRGYHVRKFVIPKKKIDQRIYQNYIDRLLKHYIEDKMIPDLVLEILTYNKYNEDVSLYSSEYKAHLEIMDKIILKVIKDISHSTVQECTSNLIGNILDERLKNKPTVEKDPFALLVQDLIMNTLKEECQDIAKSSVQDTTQDYMSEIHLRQLIKDRFINKAVKEVVIDSIEEIIVESMVEDMSEKLTKELAQPLAGRMYEMIQQEVEAVELDKALDSYIYRGMLDITLEQIGVLIDEQNRKKKEKEKQEQLNQQFMQGI